jgi:signal transduction histidine kinase/PAS domain-containing protein
MMVAAPQRRRQLLTAGIGTALILVMGAVLLFGFRLATQMRTSITALQTASTLQTYPETIAQQLNSLRDRLEVRAYSGQALSDLQTSVKRFDTNLRQLEATGDAEGPQLSRAKLLWRQYQPVLDPVISFTGQPYVDTDNGGSSLSGEGRRHYAEVKRAQLFANENARPLQTQLTTLATALQRGSSDAATRLRALLSAGVLAALVLAVAAGYFQMTRARGERIAREAQEQTRDILKSVREGFFLLDASHRIGSVWSEALAQMFSRNDFAGLSFEDLLKDLVPQATLTTATKYVKLLWGERAHENLMKSINPLGQLEITRESGGGGKETRFLQFDFHRVMGPEGVRHVLCSVSDNTASVLLARELQDSQQNANAQLDMMLGMLHVDPLQLNSFLETTETSIKLVNTILKEPARTDAEFRKKLAGLFRELHSIKGESSALNLSSIASRVHAMEDMVSECKKKPELSGNDFLPLVLKLDELLAHLRTIREMAARLSVLKDVPQPAAVQAVEITPVPARGSGAQRTRAPEAGAGSLDDLPPTLQSMAARLAQDHKKVFRLAVVGLADVPAPYAATVKDCVIQMLRNAAVHGIEAPDVRRSLAKQDVGVVSVEFRRTPGGYELVFEDDGAGMTPQNLKAAAVRKKLVTEDAAERMDTRAAMALIFAPGFSTQEGVSMDAGRGIGMDVVARSVANLGGKIGVSTHPGKFTRFRVVLPSTDAASAAVA